MWNHDLLEKYEFTLFSNSFALSLISFGRDSIEQRYACPHKLFFDVVFCLQLEGIKCIRGVLEQVDGEGMSFADILPMLSFFQTRSVKQTTTFRGPIEIGDTVKINVYGYVKVGVQAYHISIFSRIIALCATLYKNFGFCAF